MFPTDEPTFRLPDGFCPSIIFVSLYLSNNHAYLPPKAINSLNQSLCLLISLFCFFAHRLCLSAFFQKRKNPLTDACSLFLLKKGGGWRRWAANRLSCKNVDLAVHGVKKRTGFYSVLSVACFFIDPPFLNLTTNPSPS